MSLELHTLAYFSRNTIEESGGDLNAEIASILAVARSNNSRIGVTGALLFSNGCFAQVLEGPLDEVESVFEHIECDPRHRDVTILHFKPIEARTFSAWSMAFAGPADEAARQVDLEGIVKSPADIESGDAGRDVVTVLSRLISRDEEAHA